MQAEAQSINHRTPVQRARTSALITLTVLHVALHAMWLTTLAIVDSEDFGPEQYVITSATLVIGLVALSMMWRGPAWGRWILVVVTAMQLFFTVPEVFMLEGALRVISIIALLGLVVMMVVLFRPEVRNRS